MPETITFPPVCLILLMGTSGSGKSTFARKHFAPSQIVASDQCRAMVVDSAASQAANADAYALFYQWIGLRLKHRRLTVADSTAIKPSSREPLLALAKAHRVPVYVLAFDIPVDEARRRDAARPDRQVGERVIARHRITFEQAVRELAREPRLADFYCLDAAAMDTVEIRTRLAALDGSRFDVIGDVHGCRAELEALVETLGYDREGRHPEGRVLAFVGDLADRGPDSPGVLRFVCDRVAADRAVFVPGNHDDKLFRLLQGARVKRTHGLDLTEEQLQCLPDAERERLVEDVLTYLASQPCYVQLDEGRLALAHAGVRDEMLGRMSDFILRFTRYGDVRGFEENGMPIRHDWAADRENGEAGPLICYGHTPQAALRFVNNTINLDGGCVFGGFLAALRYPERTLVTVPARETYAVR